MLALSAARRSVARHVAKFRSQASSMTEKQFTTPDGIVIDNYLEVVTLLHIRHWRESPSVNRCEAWIQGADGADQLWHSPPLGLQGRAGHRYRLCWARCGATQTYWLVGARNLATKKHTLCCDTGLVASLFRPSRYGRRAFWTSCAAALVFVFLSQLLPDEIFRSVQGGLAWWHLALVPFITGTVGSCAGSLRDRRDVGKSFDKFVEESLS